MRATVKLFGPLADRFGADHVHVDLAHNQPTCAAILEALPAAAPALAGSITGCRLAVNHAFAPPHHTINPSDEIALIGMVSGG